MGFPIKLGNRRFDGVNDGLIESMIVVTVILNLFQDLVIPHLMLVIVLFPLPLIIHFLCLPKENEAKEKALSR
jgi:hypothetical protein